jgi:hypothetical protein
LYADVTRQTQDNDDDTIPDNDSHENIHDTQAREEVCSDSETREQNGHANPKEKHVER